MADIDKTNFREVARDAIKKHFDEGDMVAGLLWARIIMLYEEAVDEARTKDEE